MFQFHRLKMRMKIFKIKSNSKYEGAFDANLNVIKHYAMNALELSITKYLLFYKLNTKY